MKMKLPLYAVALAAILFSGCIVQSLHPLFMEREYISYPGLVGTWVQMDGEKEQGTWIFGVVSNRYLLTHTDEGGSKATFMVTAGRLGTNVFLNTVLNEPMVAGQPTKWNSFAAWHIVPTSAFFKVRTNEHGLTLTGMNLEWLDEQLPQNPKLIGHVYRPVGDGTSFPLLTAPTKDLQKFVAQYADDAKVFKDEVKLVPKKPAK